MLFKEKRGKNGNGSNKKEQQPYKQPEELKAI